MPAGKLFAAILSCGCYVPLCAQLFPALSRLKSHNPMTTTQHIAEQAACLDHDERWPYMITLGKSAINAPSVADALNTLASSTCHFERSLAVMAAHGSHNAELIAALAQDSSSDATGASLELAAAHLDTSALKALIPKLSRRRRRRVLQLLRIPANVTVDSAGS